MKTLPLFALAILPAFAAAPAPRIQSVPHGLPSNSILPNLIPGVVGVGSQASGYALPCMSCYGMPTGALLAPPPYYFVTPANEPPLTFYYTVETVAISGPGTAALRITEASTGKVVQDTTSDVTLPANSTNIISWDGAIADDGYRGVDTVVFTTTIGTASVQTGTAVGVGGESPAARSAGSADGAIAPNLVIGLPAIGAPVEGYGLPCISCYGAPAGTMLLPTPYYSVNARSEPPLIFYSPLETRELTGTATTTFQLTQAGTGKVVQSFSGSVDLLPNSTSLVWFGAGAPDGNGYRGADTALLTVTVGDEEVQGSTHLWVVPYRTGN
jgi:hypothetical protein